MIMSLDILSSESSSYSYLTGWSVLNLFNFILRQRKGKRQVQKWGWWRGSRGTAIWTEHSIWLPGIQDGSFLHWWWVKCLDLSLVRFDFIMHPSGTYVHYWVDWRRHRVSVFQGMKSYSLNLYSTHCFIFWAIYGSFVFCFIIWVTYVLCVSSLMFNKGYALLFCFPRAKEPGPSETWK